MPEDLWIETKKEYEVSDAGAETLKKVTRERKPPPANFAKKDIIDLIFRTISVLAIGVPVFLLFQQQKAAVRSQRALQQYDVYSSASLELHSILRRSVNEPEFKRSQDKLSYELSPKIEFQYNEKVNDRMDEVNNLIIIYKAIVGNDNIEDSLYNYEQVAGSTLSSLFADDPRQKRIVIDEETLHLLHLMDSTYSEISPSQYELTQLINRNLTSDAIIRPALHEAVRLDSTYILFHSNFIATCDSIRLACEEKKDNNTSSLRSLTTAAGGLTDKLISQRHELVNSFKEVKETVYKRLQQKSDSLKISLREANQYLDIQ